MCVILHGSARDPSPTFLWSLQFHNQMTNYHGFPRLTRLAYIQPSLSAEITRVPLALIRDCVCVWLVIEHHVIYHIWQHARYIKDMLTECLCGGIVHQKKSLCLPPNKYAVIYLSFVCDTCQHSFWRIIFVIVFF